VPIIANKLTVEMEPNRPLISDVSLRIEDGEFVLILGPSGSGKSIFGLCLNGIIPQLIPAHYTGTLMVDEFEAGQTPVSTMSTRVGIVFQDPDAQLVTMHVEDEIVFGPENLRLPRSEIAHDLERALQLVGMHDHRHAHTFTLSGGQKQRVAIGSVLAMRPSVLVLDEPTSNLDPEGTRAVFDILAHLRREKRTTIIAIEHKVDALMEHVDRIVVFDRGRIIANGPPRDVLARHGGMLEQRGVGIPHVSELALSARRKGLFVRDEELPITSSEGQKKWPIEPLLRPAKNAPAAACSKEPIVRFENVAFDYPNRSAILGNRAATGQVKARSPNSSCHCSKPHEGAFCWRVRTYAACAPSVSARRSAMFFNIPTRSSSWTPFLTKLHFHCIFATCPKP
jgi:energy-coupling factor transport system ATP-binding protein